MTDGRDGEDDSDGTESTEETDEFHVTEDGDDGQWNGGPLDPSRDRGVLTERDRRFLLGLGDYDDDHARKIRMTIRERCIQGMYDMLLLFREMPMRDMEQVAMEFSPEELRVAVEGLAFYQEFIEKQKSQMEERNRLYDRRLERDGNARGATTAQLEAILEDGGTDEQSAEETAAQAEEKPVDPENTSVDTGPDSDADT